MGDAQSHLSTWQSAGLIDDTTANRIRTWEQAPAGPRAARERPNVVSILGPSVSIAEAFAYLGVVFLLAASDVFLARMSTSSPSPDLVLAVGSAIQAVALAVVGYSLLRGDARRRRAAGVAFLVATGHAGVAAWFGAQALGIEGPFAAVLGSIAATILAAAARQTHPALTTQAALLGAITCLATASLTWIEQLLFGAQTFDGTARNGTEQLALTVGSAGWWLFTGLVLGLVGLYESRQEGTADGAEHRAGLTRLWAGIVVISGFCTALTRSDMLPGGTYGRVVEPWIAELAILVVSAILIERAFRRNSAAFVIAGAIGMIVALTDFNFSYLADQTEVGLLIEGLILLAVGFGADRIRRRLRPRPAGDVAPVTPPAGQMPDQPAEAAAPGE